MRYEIRDTRYERIDRKLLVVALLSLFTLVGARASASANDCIPPIATHDTDNRVPVVVDDLSFETHLYNDMGFINSGFWTYDRVAGAVVQALEQWNHSALGREFYFAGRETDIKRECGIVKIYAENRNGPAFAESYTDNGNCDVSGARISLPRRTSSGLDRRWVISDRSLVTGAYQAEFLTDYAGYLYNDMIFFLIHELGHTVGIGDLPSGTGDPAAVMQQAPISSRDLYKLDQDCAKLYYDDPGGRSLTGTDHHFSGGTWSSSTVAAGVTSGSPGVSAGGQNITANKFRGVWITSLGTYADAYSSGSQFLTSQTPVLGPTRIHRRALTAQHRDAIVFAGPGASFYGSKHDEFFVPSIYIGMDGFDTSNFVNRGLKTCTNPGAGLLSTCGESELIKTNRRIAFAFDDYNDRTVAAWANLDRQSDIENNELKIAAGFYASGYGDTMGPALDLGVKTDVAPALACKAFQAGSSYDCIVAFTNPWNPDNRIKMIRFYLGSTGGDYFDTIYDDPNTQLVTSGGWHRTASPMALFHHDGKWWLAYRGGLATGSGALRLYSSPSGDTDTWSLEAILGYAATGGNSISDWTISNKVYRLH